MERFLREYVKDITEGMGITLTQKQMRAVLNKIECDDEIWEILDSHIKNKIDDVISLT